jgi:hypothetical protein
VPPVPVGGAILVPGEARRHVVGFGR